MRLFGQAAFSGCIGLCPIQFSQSRGRRWPSSRAAPARAAMPIRINAAGSAEVVGEEVPDNSCSPMETGPRHLTTSAALSTDGCTLLKQSLKPVPNVRPPRTPQSSGKRCLLRTSMTDLIVSRSLKFWGRPVSTGMLKVWLRVRRPKHDVNTFGTYNCQR